MVCFRYNLALHILNYYVITCYNYTPGTIHFSRSLPFESNQFEHNEKFYVLFYLGYFIMYRQKTFENCRGKDLRFSDKLLCRKNDNGHEDRYRGLSKRPLLVRLRSLNSTILKKTIFLQDTHQEGELPPPQPTEC